MARDISVAPALGSYLRKSLRDVAERLVERVEVADWRARDDRTDGLAVSLAFLVSREGIGGFLARVAPVAARAGVVAVVPTGPWGPASFAPGRPFPDRRPGGPAPRRLIDLAVDEGFE